MEILAKKLPYIKLEGRYREWKAREDLRDAREQLYRKHADLNTEDVIRKQAKAKTVAQNILMLDNYVYDKAEDVEAVFETFNVQLLAGVSALATVPKAVLKFIPILEKQKSTQNIANALKNYQKKTIKIGGGNFKLSSVLTGLAVAVSGLLYARGVTRSIKSQLGATRRAKFEGLTEKFNNDTDYALLTPEQEDEITKQLLDKNNPINKEKEVKTPFLSKILERINVRKSLKQTKDLTMKNAEYLQHKAEFEKELANPKYIATKENRQILENIIKKVDLKSEDDLERMEKIVNVGYSSLFVGGFLEYLISDKLIDLLKIKNPVIREGAKILIPLVTYLVLNKNIANLQNNAIQATHYKNLKNYVENRENFVDVPVNFTKVTPEQKKKPNLFNFLKGMLKDIREYEKFEETGLKDLNKRHELKKSILLNPEQKKEAEMLRKNTLFTLHTEADNRKHFAQGVEAISEIALAPFEIASTALGAFLGSKVGAHFTSGKMKKLSMALGAIVAFIPTAIVEIMTTAEQKKALRIASMTTIEEMDKSRMFKDAK